MKLDRLMGILTLLLQNERVTAPYLAEKFEVSRRTIGRDIDALCQAGIPVITYQGGGGGISIADGFKLDKSILTTDELSVIITGLKGIGSVSDKSNIERILDKLSANTEAVVSLRDSIVIDLASHYKGNLTGKIKVIRTAVQEQRLVEFDYYYEKGTVHRRIEPYFVVFQWTAWYLFGFCTLRQDYRMFKLQRLWDLRICDETFSLREREHDNARNISPDNIDFSSYLADDKKLVAVFDPSVKYLLIESYGLNSYTETEKGLLRLETSYTNYDFTLSWILGFGDKATVLEPIEMANHIKRIAENIIRQYILRTENFFQN